MVRSLTGSPHAVAALAGKLTDAKSVQGQQVKVDATKGGVSVDNAKVVKADTSADNGLIHVIDAVILPK